MRRQCRNIAQITAAPLYSAHSNSIHGPRRNTGTKTIGETVENPYPALMESQQEKKRNNRQDEHGMK